MLLYFHDLTRFHDEFWKSKFIPAFDVRLNLAWRYVFCHLINFGQDNYKFLWLVERENSNRVSVGKRNFDCQWLKLEIMMEIFRHFSHKSKLLHVHFRRFFKEMNLSYIYKLNVIYIIVKFDILSSTVPCALCNVIKAKGEWVALRIFQEFAVNNSQILAQWIIVNFV